MNLFWSLRDIGNLSTWILRKVDETILEEGIQSTLYFFLINHNQVYRDKIRHLVVLNNLPAYPLHFPNKWVPSRRKVS